MNVILQKSKAPDFAEKKKKKTVWKDASRAVKATSDHLKVPPEVNEWIKQIAFNEYNPEK